MGGTRRERINEGLLVHNKRKTVVAQESGGQLLVALDYERWDGGNKETSLGQKSVLKGEELETTREYGTYEDGDALGAGRLSSIEGRGWYSSLPCNEKTTHGGR